MIDIGTVVNGKYRLVRLLGDGGMGSVYEALHTVLGTRVAIKVLHPELTRRTGLVERFLQEARVAAQIRSPHVVQVTDIDRTSEGHAYIVMELLEGEPLSSVLDRQHKLPVPLACEYAGQILSALEAAHALGVIHRDLKPENVFVTFAGGRPVLKLIDFGIAKARRLDPQQKNLTVAGVVMGTAEYMAPEQARSADKVDARSDIYAVGVMLYEMIAGARPVGGDDARIIALKVERGEATPLVQVAPGARPEIAGLVHRAMAARPEMRFANADRDALGDAGGDGRYRPRGPRVDRLGWRTGRGERHGQSGALERCGQRGGLRVVRTRSKVGPNPPPVDTIRAPPIATAMTPSPYVGMMTPAGPLTGPRRSRAPLAALVALPVLLGAGIVALVVGAGSSGSATPPIAPAPSAEGSRPPSAPPPVTVETSQPPASSAVPTLTPTRPGPSPRATAPRPAASSAPADAGASGSASAETSLPAAFPNGLPPFPTAFPSGFGLPSPFPTSFPSALPTALPSGFPTTLPAWPPPAASPPPKSHASSSTSADPAY